MSNFKDVQAFHDKFGIERPQAPCFLGPQTFDFRVKFMKEELDEFIKAHLEGDIYTAADSLVDLVYVVMGTADMMGLPWKKIWDEVQRANMAKRRAANAGESKRGSALDVIKPEGWTPPDHRMAIDGRFRKHGWNPAIIGENGD